jgi:hypothetical protein
MVMAPAQRMTRLWPALLSLAATMACAGAHEPSAARRKGALDGAAIRPAQTVFEELRFAPAEVAVVQRASSLLSWEQGDCSFEEVSGDEEGGEEAAEKSDELPAGPAGLRLLAIR